MPLAYTASVWYARGMGKADATAFFSEYGDATARAWKTVDLGAAEHAADVLLDAYLTGAHVFACGNGGSASIANHLVCDHVKGIRTGTGFSPRVTSLSSNVELLTAIANDVSYSEIFSYQLQAQAETGDVLIAISSSGRSPNINRAIFWALSNGLQTIALTGFNGGTARKLAEVKIHVDSDNYGIIEDVHQGVMHSLAQYIIANAVSE
jgi:phosphoheptose isomerase